MPRQSRVAIFLSAVLIAGVGLPVQAWAGRTRIHEAAESDVYGRKMGGMLGRGLLNGLTCFVDVIVNIVNETRNGPPLVGTFTGVGKGLGCGVLRLGSGVVDIATFWVPGFNGAPVSASYTNCFDDAGTEGYSRQAPANNTGYPYADPSEFNSTAQQPVEIPVYQQPATPSVAQDKPRWSK